MHLTKTRCAELRFATVLLLTVLLTGAVATARTITYDDSWNPSGINLAAADRGSVEVTYAVTEWQLNRSLITGQQLHTLQLPGTWLPNDAGKPDLPGVSRYIALPEGAEAVLHIISSRTETYHDIDLAPAPEIPRESDPGPLVYPRDDALYNRDAFYPDQPVQLSTITQLRGVDAVLLGITPFQYNPVRRELIVYRDLEIEITFQGGNGQFGEERLRSRWWDPLLQDALLNHASLPAVDYSARPQSRDTGAEYLIITPNDATFIAWADSIRHWRQLQGISTQVTTTAQIGGNSHSLIEAYINSAYNTWDIPPTAFLLLGDYGTSGNTIDSPTWDSYCVSDNIYADIDGDDLPEIAHARITARDGAELALMIGKFLDYERQPPLNAGFYSNPIMAGGWQDERWFILCSEIVEGYMEHVLGKTPVREYAIYSGSPGTDWSTNPNTSMITDYFGPSGLGYIPATPAHLTDWGANATRLNNDINSGAFILQHRDHGGESGWGEPDYEIADLAGLSNEDLIFVFSINCLTGKYNIAGECFTEAFHRHPQGALGLIAASETSYSFVNDTYVWGMYDRMWPDFDPGYGLPGDPQVLPCFANTAGKYYLQASSWPYNPGDKTVTYHLFHHHGDAFSTVYAQMPQNLTVAHDPALLSGINFFTVTADPGALVALTVDGEIIGTGEGTGYPVSIPITAQLPGNTLEITVTKQDCYRYAQSVQIIPPDGAYVVYRDHAINDAAGNGNGQLDFTEDVLLAVTAENVGLDTAIGVTTTLATADSYTTVIDGDALFGDFDPAEQVTLPDCFEIAVGADVPDQHPIPFTFTATDGDSTWVSYFTITAQAPLLSIDQIAVLDGDNGRLDAGETVDLEVHLLNDGGAGIANLLGTLDCLDGYITINDGSDSLPQLAAGVSDVMTFNVTADAGTPIGHPVEFLFDLTADDFTFSDDFGLAVGLSIEDFETGAFASYPWAFGGNAGWSVVTTTPWEGTYCANSDGITHNQTAELTLDVEVIADGTLSFYYRVSSEGSWDYLRFTVDGSEVGSWSGEIGWTQATYSISAGPHTFTWKYTKDGSVDSGSDCAWIDYIIFPPLAAPDFPSITVTPLVYDVWLEPGTSTQRDLTIGNVDDGTLHYTLDVVRDLAQRTAGENDSGEVYSLDGRKESLDPTLYDADKNRPDPRRGSNQSRGSGGPDLFGYTWVDSNEPGGPVFNWVDITGSGTPITLTDDDYATVNLPFGFEFYGAVKTQVKISSNGYLTFGGDGTDYSNDPIPGSTDPNDFIAPFWDDLNPTLGGTIHYLAENTRLVVQFTNIQHYGGGGTYSFQVEINANGTMLFQYLSMSGTLNSATIGLENSSGGDGLQVVYNATYVESNLAVSLRAAPLWLTVTPLAGDLEELEELLHTVTFDASELESGVYNGSITVNSNDPVNWEILIPVTLTVDSAPPVPDPVTDLVITIEGNDVLLDWSYDGPATFHIYSCGEPYETYVYLTSTTETEATLVDALSGQRVFYRVTVEN